MHAKRVMQPATQPSPTTAPPKELVPLIEVMWLPHDLDEAYEHDIASHPYDLAMRVCERVGAESDQLHTVLLAALVTIHEHAVSCGVKKIVLTVSQ